MKPEQGAFRVSTSSHGNEGGSGTFDEASSGLLVQAFHVPLLTNVNWRVNEHLKELEARLSVEAPRSLSVLCTHVEG